MANKSRLTANLVSSSGVSTFSDLNITRANVTGISTFSDLNASVFKINANSVGAAVTITQAGSGDFIHVGTAGSAFVISNDGKIGIGSTIPGETLSVGGNIRVGASTDSNYIAFRGTTGDDQTNFATSFIGERIYSETEDSELLLFKGNDSSFHPGGPDRIRLYSNQIILDTYGTPNTGPSFGSFEEVGLGTSKTQVAITTAGVLFGTTSQTSSEDGIAHFYNAISGAKTQFVHVAGQGGIRIGGSGNGSSANIVFSNDYNSGTWSDEYTINMNGSDDSLNFVIGGTGISSTPTLTLLSNGKIGINTVASNIATDNGQLIVAGDILVKAHPTTDKAKIRFGFTNGVIQSGKTGDNTGNDRLVISGNGGGREDFSVGYDGTVTVHTGNLVFSTSGKGIDFSATSGTGTSELFDDYEEGTWTPNGSRTFTHATYTKIGRQVFCQFTCTNPSGMGQIGLPFTPSNNVTGSGSSEQVRYVGDVQFFVSGGNDDSIYKYIWQGNIGSAMYLHKLSGSGAQSWTATFGSYVSQVTVFISFIVA